jgi:hypothetical protein
VSQCFLISLGPVLASRAPSPPAAVAADWRGLGRVPIAGWSLGRVGPGGVFGGEEEGGGVRSGPGEARTILLLHVISARPFKQRLMVPSSRYIWSSAPILFLQEQIKDIIIIDLVDVLHNGLALYNVLDKSISADGSTKANVAVNHKRRGREQGTEVREGEICIEHALCCSVRISHRDTLDENLGLVEIKVEASILLEYMLDVREHL